MGDVLDRARAGECTCAVCSGNHAPNAYRPHTLDGTCWCAAGQVPGNRQCIEALKVSGPVSLEA